MAFDAFLKIEAVGDKAQELELRLESFSWGVSNSGSISSAGGLQGGKPMFQDFSFASLAGEQSPKLFEAAATGQHFPNAILTVTDKVQFMMVTFTDVLISSYKIDEGSLFSQKHVEGGIPAVQLGAPMESVSFNFAKFDFQVGKNSAMGGPLG
jgi:type VI secretion system secreted protein Hcp